MNFDSIDWEFEARRIERAFAVVEWCTFRLIAQKVRRLEVAGSRLLLFSPLTRSHFDVSYYNRMRQFALMLDGETGSYTDEIYITWEGVVFGASDIRDGDRLARPLHHLGLLTPEVEAALKVSISAHQKLDWSLEYEARYGL